MQEAKAIVSAESSDGVDGLASFLRAQPMSDANEIRLLESELEERAAYQEKTRNVSVGTY